MSKRSPQAKVLAYASTFACGYPFNVRGVPFIARDATLAAALLLDF
jgi:hypothetical protein